MKYLLGLFSNTKPLSCEDAKILIEGHISIKSHTQYDKVLPPLTQNSSIQSDWG